MASQSRSIGWMNKNIAVREYPYDRYGYLRLDYIKAEFP